jgi:hypothetical protein
MNNFNEIVAKALADRELLNTPSERVAFYADSISGKCELILYPFNGQYLEKPVMHISYYSFGRDIRRIGCSRL